MHAYLCGAGVPSESFRELSTGFPAFAARLVRPQTIRRGALAGPVTAFLYDSNMLPIGQLLWEKELMSYKEFPPLHAPETYNREGS